VTIVGAKNVAPMDRGGTSDPYCIVTSTLSKQRFKTKIMKKTLNPEWNEEFGLFADALQGRLFLKCWDKDLISDDFLGELSIDLSTVTPNETLDQWYSLNNEPKQKPTNQEPAQIHIKIHYPAPNGQQNQTNNQTNNQPREKSKFTDLYNLGKELGRGGFSIVYEGIRKEDNTKFAVKVIAKNQSEDELSLLRREIDIMKKLKHEHIISLSDYFEDNETIYLILELAVGGELFDQIISRGSYSERDAAGIILQILEATTYMHEKGIAHRDLKPENLLVTGEGYDVIKISDFGLSKDFGTENLKTSCGTPDYVAPEVLKGTSYDHSVDIWSIGVITYILLCGFPPFYGNTNNKYLTRFYVQNTTSHLLTGTIFLKKLRNLSEHY
jgi:tRNA A-37 threonylcarbamoyl transferase component Bud32